jgi:hypothetical protein
MAEVIIDFLEVVQIEKQDGRRIPALLRLFDGLVKLREEQIAIGRTGQRVSLGSVRKRCSRRL